MCHLLYGDAAACDGSKCRYCGHNWVVRYKLTSGFHVKRTSMPQCCSPTAFLLSGFACELQPVSMWAMLNKQHVRHLVPFRSVNPLPALAGSDAAPTSSSSGAFAQSCSNAAPTGSSRGAFAQSCSNAAPTGSSSGGLTQFGKLPAPAGKHFHVFISHAGEQKGNFVAMLLEKFEALHPTLKVFVDETSLLPGGSALKNIHTALGDAFAGVYVANCVNTCTSNSDAVRVGGCIGSMWVWVHAGGSCNSISGWCVVLIKY
jgi:hypothetical protein